MLFADHQQGVALLDDGVGFSEQRGVAERERGSQRCAESCHDIARELKFPIVSRVAAKVNDAVFLWEVKDAKVNRVSRHT